MSAETYKTELEASFAQGAIKALEDKNESLKATIKQLEKDKEFLKKANEGLARWQDKVIERVEGLLS